MFERNDDGERCEGCGAIPHHICEDCGCCTGCCECDDEEDTDGGEELYSS